MMFGFLETIFPQISLVKIGLWVALAVGVGTFVWDWHHRGVVIQNQQLEMSVLKGDLASSEERLRITKDGYAAAQKRAADAQALLKTTEQIATEASHVTATPQDKISSVLARSLSATRQLQQQHSGARP